MDSSRHCEHLPLEPGPRVLALQGVGGTERGQAVMPEGPAGCWPQLWAGGALTKAGGVPGASASAVGLSFSVRPAGCTLYRQSPTPRPPALPPPFGLLFLF